MFERSEIGPMIARHIAPPTIDITRSEDPRLVNRPRFLMLRAKIVGNMIEWKKPIRTMAKTETRPELATETAAQTSEPPANRANRFGGEIRFIMPEPPKRPIMKPRMCGLQ